MEVSYSIFRTIKTSNWTKILWAKRSLIEYKKEAFELFENLLNKLKTDFITILMNLKFVEETPVKNSEEDLMTKLKYNSKYPNCLLKIKIKMISRNEKCQVTGKKFKNDVVVLIEYKLMKQKELR